MEISSKENIPSIIKDILKNGIEISSKRKNNGLEKVYLYIRRIYCNYRSRNEWVYSISLSRRRSNIMKKLIIMLDFISGPLWKGIYDTKKKELITVIDVVYNDKYIKKIK